jgi:16S rRNA (guanine527-N7)-methyltransferase
MLPTPRAVEELLRSHYPAADRQLAARVLDYLALLVKWNAKLNLTSETAVGAVRRHFGESFFAATLVPLKRGTLVDVGSGAGFPGLALKLIRPELKVILLEPSRKKCAFLAEVARSLKLQDVRVVAKRAHEAEIGEGSVDYVTFRAIGEHLSILRWASRVLRQEGKVIAWLGAEDAKALAQTKGWEVTAMEAIPGREASVVVVLSKAR